MNLKKLSIALTLLLLTACSNVKNIDSTTAGELSTEASQSETAIEQQTDAPAGLNHGPVDEELIALFETYIQDESMEAGQKILDYFLSEPREFITTFAEFGNRELILMLLGSSIYQANQDGDLRYQEVLDELGNMDLTEREKGALNFISANIEAAPSY